MRKGRYGKFGGRYVPETLVPALDRLQAGVDRYLGSADFLAEFIKSCAAGLGGRPRCRTPAP
jgi:tryptophan synthase beta subunit